MYIALTFSEKCGGDEAGHADEGGCASCLLPKDTKTKTPQIIVPMEEIIGE